MESSEMCYFCENTMAITLKYDKPSCFNCAEVSFVSSTFDPQKDSILSDEDKAKRHKVLIKTFRNLYDS